MNRKILLIQSDVGGAVATRGALSDVGCGGRQVLWAKTLAQGTEWLDQSARAVDPSICAVVCDLGLTHGQVDETFDRLLAHSPSIPIFMLDDDANGSAAERAVTKGAQGCFSKTGIEHRLMIDAIERSIERSDHASILFEAQHRAQVILEAIADGVISTDEAGRVTYCNPVAATLTGWTREEAAGRPVAHVLRLIHERTRARLPDPLARSMRENATVSLAPDCLLVRADGGQTATEDSAAPIHDRSGKVVGAVIVFRDVSAARAAATRISYVAEHDALTDLPNRVLLTDRLSQAIERATRQRQMLAVLFLDVDRFKNINDSLGHAVGDRLLLSVARRLMACVRASDTVSRQGGDEFVILLPDIGCSDDVVVTAEKILAAVALPQFIDDFELHVTASIGVVVFPKDGADDATLLKNADAAMYHAKENGRNNIQFFTPDLHVRAVARHRIETEMRQALRLDQFVLYYQPIVALEHEAIVGVEALVRWRHPQRGLLSPESFMAVAEQCGFVVPMGRWVMRQACRQARAWRDAGFPAMRIAINSSALELRTKGFVEAVRESLDATALAPEFLEIEITETVLLQESQSTGEILGALAGLGVHLALDDFGTGYSSLSHLKLHPISTLKIDRSFICELATDSSDARIVNAVIGLGRSLGLRVVAEGVETAQQARLLRAEGCVEAQGHHFGRPVEAGTLTALLASRRARGQGRVARST